MSDDARRDAVASIIEPVVVAAGYDLDEVSLAQAGRRIVVRIAVDADAGLNLDAVADISREISEALDAGPRPPLGDDPYTLEVGSRGVSAPLLLERHWRRNIGRLVLITFTDKARPKLTGRITAAGPDSATVRADDGSEHALAYSDIRRATVQVEFTKSVAGSAPVDDSADDDVADDDGDDAADDDADDDDEED